MPFTPRPLTHETMLADWQRCKELHEQATFTVHVSKGWADGAATPWIDALSKRAHDFLYDYGFQFDPKADPATLVFKEKTHA